MSVKLKTNSISALPTSLIEGCTTDAIEDRSAYIRSDGTLTWSGSSLSWTANLIIDIVNTASGTVTSHTISSTDSPKSLIDGESLYVAISRTSTSETLTLQKTAVTPIPAQTPTNRSIYVIARRKDGLTADLHIPLAAKSIGPATTFDFKASTTVVATTSTTGAVQLSATPSSSSNPLVVTIMANGKAEITATGGNSHAFKGTGNGTGAGLIGVASSGNAIEATGGNIAFTSGGKVTGMTTPSATTDAATKLYVDRAIMAINVANWQIKTTPGISQPFLTAAYGELSVSAQDGDTGWVVGAGNSTTAHCTASCDGGFWRDRTSTLTALSSATPIRSSVFGKNTAESSRVFLVGDSGIGTAGDPARIHYSTDFGNSWTNALTVNSLASTPAGFSTGLYYGGDTFLAPLRKDAAVAPTIYTAGVATPSSWTERTLTSAAVGSYVTKIAYSGAYWVALGSGFSGANTGFVTNSLASNFTNVDVGTTSACVDLVYDSVNAKMIALFANGNIKYSSAPFTSWTLSTTLAGSCLATDGAGVTVLGLSGSTGFYFSTDGGATWSLSSVQTYGSSVGINKVVYGAGHWVASSSSAASSVSLLLSISSEDLLLSTGSPTKKWKRRYLSTGTLANEAITNLYYGNRQFLAITPTYILTTPATYCIF